MSAEWRIPRESTEWIGPVTVTVDGEPAATFEVALLRYGLRPTDADWQQPTTLDGGQGVLADQLEPGTYALWVRVTDNPEVVVLTVGGVRVT